jgi:hypothetical protein
MTLRLARLQRTLGRHRIDLELACQFGFRQEAFDALEVSEEPMLTFGALQVELEVAVGFSQSPQFAPDAILRMPAAFVSVTIALLHMPIALLRTALVAVLVVVLVTLFVVLFPVLVFLRSVMSRRKIHFERSETPLECAFGEPRFLANADSVRTKPARSRVGEPWHGDHDQLVLAERSLLRLRSFVDFGKESVDSRISLLDGTLSTVSQQRFDFVDEDEDRSLRFRSGDRKLQLAALAFARNHNVDGIALLAIHAAELGGRQKSLATVREHNAGAELVLGRDRTSEDGVFAHSRVPCL